MARQQPSLDQSLEEPPPVPPQRLNSGDIRGLQIGREPLAEYNVMGVKGSTRSPKSSLRRTSSAGDLEESIKHLQVRLGFYINLANGYNLFHLGYILISARSCHFSHCSVHTTYSFRSFSHSNILQISYSRF